MPNKNFYSFSGKETKSFVKKPPANSVSKVNKVAAFDKISDFVSNIIGSSQWFVFSIGIIIVWLFSGFFIGFDETWHSLIHTITSVVTLLLMALLHYSQKKWEKRMEQMENHQDKVLELLERDTTEIKYDLDQYEKVIMQYENEKQRVRKEPEYLAVVNNENTSLTNVESIDSLI